MAVRLRDYTWTPPGARRPALRDVSLEIACGECLLVTGATGSGKSSLLRAIGGALPGGSMRGHREVPGRAGLLFQDVETQLLFTTVEEEVASGLSERSDQDTRRARVEDSLERVGLAGFARRSLTDLSAGERQRVVLAALLAGDPELLLLDEPTSALDPPARRDLVAALARLKARGHTLIVAEHATEPFRELADRWLSVEAGLVSFRDAPACAPRPRQTRAQAASDAPLVVRGRGISVEDPEGHVRLPRTDLELRAGERLRVSGRCGAGKTTLLHVLAGVLPARGALELGAALGREPGSRPGRVAPGRIALVLQNPPRNLFARSVAEEVGFTLARLGADGAATRTRVLQILEACDLMRFRNDSPLRLSFGEQHSVAIAAALASKPALLLLDEPFAGLDAGLRNRLLGLIEDEQRRTGMAVVIACHDPEPLEGWAGRQIQLPDPARRPARSHPEPARSRRLAAAPGRACHYRDTGSPLHRLGVSWKLLAVALSGAAAVGLRTPLSLATLFGVWLAGYHLARLSVAELWEDTRWLLAQGIVIAALSWLRGGAEGLASGARSASQIALFFLPGALLLRTTPAGRLLAGVRRALPARLAFALTTSLRFIPFFSRELHEILTMQRLRGARLDPCELWRPRAWRDAVDCAGVPLAVRVIRTANEVAQAADLRGVVAVRREGTSR